MKYDNFAKCSVKHDWNNSPVPLVLRDKFHPEILIDSSERGVKQGFGEENKLSCTFVRRCLENGTRYVQSYY